MSVVKKKKNQKGLEFIVSLYRGTQFIMDKTLKLSLNSYKKKLNKLGLRGRIVYIYIYIYIYIYRTSLIIIKFTEDKKIYFYFLVHNKMS